MREEVADVFAYLLRLADVLELDLAQVLDQKIQVNASKYPIELARGNARKYNALAGSEELDVVAVDWSGKRIGPEKNIWTARARDGSLVSLEGGRSREQVIQDLISLRDERPEGLIVGLDFAFSFPAWFVRELGCSSAYELWGVVESQGEQWLTSCEPPFWGKPGKKRPPSTVEHLRRTESEVGRRSASPKSAFQIGGAGAVGTGSVRGMPFLRVLHDEGFSIWPFDPPSRWTVVEIYPRLLTGPVVKSSAEAREQFVNLAEWQVTDGQRAQVCGSEDAFDAAASALAMDRRIADLSALPEISNPDRRLEGEIWQPDLRN